MNVDMTKDEIVSYLNKSKMVTVLTEGSTDYFIFRKFEKRLSDIGVDFLPVGGGSGLFMKLCQKFLRKEKE